MKDGDKGLGYLRKLVRSAGADQGRRLTRALAVAVIPATAGLATACYAAPMGEMYGPEPEVCSDGFDNDGDGAVDCLDSDCSSLELCNGCDDGYDNDGDGASDCGDESCSDAEACAGDCSNETDDDGDGFVDCDDPDCAGSPACA